jgi:hypothetical protein
VAVAQAPRTQQPVGEPVAVGVAVAVGVGDPHDASEAVNFWPVATGGFVPPVGSHPNSVKLVVLCSTPTVRNLPVAVKGVTKPYVKSKGGVPLSYRFTS